MPNFVSANRIAEVAALIGDAARANMLSALMGGHALTAGELARHAGVTPQTTSGHLTKLLEAELVALERQGRHRYYRIASTEVAQAMQALMSLAAEGPRRHYPVGPREEALRRARTCYDHLAGRLAVGLADAMAAQGFVQIGEGAALVTGEGRRFLAGFGIALEEDGRARRPLCRTCLDWSERRPHLAGRVGAALLQRMLTLQWLARRPDSRALRILPAGEDGLAEIFRLPVDQL
ncbi:MAG: helix-turn-helix transcriptional regulator [Alphaproteobacteria bacterium]|nr:helix-turn-helix transcriptional regulator [Alphaproteobacteria bacterium]